MCNLSCDVNNWTKINYQSVKYPSKNLHRQYYRLWCEIIPSQDDYIKMHNSMHENIEF